jgi:hypothetical protein
VSGRQLALGPTPGTIECLAVAPLASPSRPLRVGNFFVGWVYGPWVAALALVVLALRLLLDEDFDLHSHAWGLFGNAAICFSIGCVCKVTWGLARGNALRQLEARLRQELGLR